MTMTNGEKQYYRPDEIAAEFALTLRSVYHWIKIGGIKHVHLGKHIRVPAAEVDRLRTDGLSCLSVPRDTK